MFAAISFPSTGCERWRGDVYLTWGEKMIVVIDFSTTVLINYVNEKIAVACEVTLLVPLRHLLTSYIHDPCHRTISIRTTRTILLHKDGRMVLVTLSQLTKKSVPPDVLIQISTDMHYLATGMP